MNKAKVDVGQSPPLDLVSAQAEVASDEEQLIVAQTAVKEAEDRLRLLILDTTQRDSWTVSLDTVDSPPVAGRGAGPRRRRRQRAARSRGSGAGAQGHRELADQPQVHAQSATARRAVQRELSGERARGHPGAPYRRVPRHRRRIGHGHGLRVGPESGAGPRLPDVDGRPQRLVSNRPERGRGQLRPRPAREHSGPGTPQERRGARDPAGARRRLEDRDERQADTDGARGARAGRTAAGLRNRNGSRWGCQRASW